MARGLGIVEIFAFGAVKTDSAHVRNVVLAHRQKRLAFAHNTGTFAEVALLVLVDLDLSQRDMLL